MIGIHENDTSEHDKRINGIVTNGYMDKWNIGKWEMKYGNKKMKIKVQLDSAKFWNFDKTPCEFLPELKGAHLDCVVQFSKIWTGVHQWGGGRRT